MIPSTHRLQPILISRFIINLRRTQHANDATDMARQSRFISNFRVPTLASFVGNMGEPLEFGARDGDSGLAGGKGEILQTVIDRTGRRFQSTLAVGDSGVLWDRRRDRR